MGGTLASTERLQWAAILPITTTASDGGIGSIIPVLVGLPWDFQLF